MKAVPYMCTLQVRRNSELGEILGMWAVDNAPRTFWSAGAEEYVYRHFERRSTQRQASGFDQLLGQYTRTWTITTSWNIATTLLVARLWTLEPL